jgi:hypothetical protein
MGQNVQVTSPATPTSPSGPPGSGAAPQDPNAAKRPSTAGYVIAAVVAIVGSVAGIVLLFVSIAALEVGSSGYRRVEVPGETVFELDLDGEYLLHGETSDDGGAYDTLYPPIVTVRGPDDRPVSVRSTTVSTRRSHVEDGRDGYRFGSFVAYRPGRYTVSVRERTASDPEPRTQSGAVADLAPEVVAIESPIRPSAMAGAIGGGSLFALSWLVGFGLWFVTLIRRGSAHRRAWTGPAGSDPWRAAGSVQGTTASPGPTRPAGERSS